MEVIRKTSRDDETFEKHKLRCETCKQTASFCYRQNSYNTFEILKSYWYCNSYCCPECALRKKCKLYRKFRKLKYKSKMGFLTLTLDTKLYTEEQSVSFISGFFNLLVKLLRYRGFKFQYFKMIELTKNHQAHIHALISTFIDRKILVELWKQITGSFIVDIRCPKSKKHVVNYVLKYITKSTDEYQNYIFYILSRRRYSYSQNFFLPDDEQRPFVKVNAYWNYENEYLNCVHSYFKLKYNHYKLINFIFLN